MVLYMGVSVKLYRKCEEKASKRGAEFRIANYELCNKCPDVCSGHSQF